MTFKEDKSPTLDELVPQVVAAIEERDRYRTLLSQQTIVSSELLDYLSKMDSQVGEICQVLGLTKDADLPSLKNKVNETAQELQTKIGKLARAYEKISSFESTVQHYRSIMGSIQSSLGTINSEIFTRALSVSTTEEVKESVESVCDQLNDYYASLKIHSEEKEEILCLLKNIVGCPESESLRKYLRMTGNVKNEIIVEALRKKVIEQEEKKKAEEKLKELKSKDIEGIISKGLMEKRWIKPLAWSAAVMIFGGIIWKGVNYYDGKAETVNEEIIIDAQREVASQDAPAATPGTAADTPIPYTMRILTEGHVPDSKEYNLNFSNFGEIELTAFSSARLSLSTSIKDLLDCTISCKDNHTKIQLKESKELYLIDYCGEITTPEELTLEVKCRQIQANSPEKIALATIQIYEQTEPAAPPPSEENNNGGDIPADVPAITLKIDKFECPSTINRGKLSDKENVCQYMVSEKSERQKISCTIGCNGHEELLEVKKSEKSEKRLSHLCMKEEAILTLGMKCQYAS